MYYKAIIANLSRAFDALQHNPIIHSTDTLNSLSADATNSDTIQKIINFKERKGPFSIMLSSIQDINKYAEIDNKTFKIIKKILPGAFTVLLKKKKKNNLSNLVFEKSNLIGVRVPKHFFTIKLIETFKRPIITTSLNKTGEIPILNLKNIDNIYKDILIFDDDKKKKSKGSTILDLSNNQIKILRDGDGIYKI